MKALKEKAVPFVLFVGLLIALSACAAPMDASKAISRSVIQSGGIVPAEELRVAEYLSYYEQRFPEPTNSTLGLDLRIGNPQVPVSGGEAWLQIGIPARSTKAEEIAPLNLALVIDRSGSMDTPQKMPYLKQSLRVFLSSLAANDMVAIITYSDNAEVLVSSRQVGDGAWIDSAIERLRPSGSTNLHAGLMLGLQEVDRNFDIRRNNRVILLTDGIANRGVTDPNRIAADALASNQKGIYLSTIGLGRDFNDALLSKLASQGKGAYHFVDSAEEMNKVFRRDVSGLIQKAAADVVVLLEPASDVRVVSITGYEGQPPAGPVQIRLRDMGTGDSQIILARLDVAPAGRAQRTLANLTLQYTDLFSQRQQSIRLPMLATASSLERYDPLQDTEVLRNVTIQRTAEGLKEISRLYRLQQYQAAYDLAVRLEQDLRRVAALTREQQMTKDADLMRTYQATLAKHIETQAERTPSSLDSAQPTRLMRQTDPKADVPSIEVK